MKFSVLFLISLLSAPVAFGELQAVGSGEVPLTSLVGAKPSLATKGLLIGPAVNLKQMTFPLLEGKAMAILTVEYRGEPLARPTHVTLDTHCVRTDGRWARALIRDFDVYAFKGLSFDEAKKILTLNYQTSQLIGGVVDGGTISSVKIPLKCAK